MRRNPKWSAARRERCAKSTQAPQESTWVRIEESIAAANHSSKTHIVGQGKIALPKMRHAEHKKRPGGNFVSVAMPRVAIAMDTTELIVIADEES